MLIQHLLEEEIPLLILEDLRNEVLKGYLAAFGDWLTPAGRRA